MSENKYFIPDIETGYSHEVSKETYEAYMSTWEYFRPKISNDKLGRVQFYGTGGSMDSMGNFKEIFFKFTNYEQI